MSFGVQGLGFSNPSTIYANTVIVFGPKSGVFLYSGTPGPTNPPVAYMTTQNTDPYGNPTPPIFSVGHPTSTGGFTVDGTGDISLYNNSGKRIIFGYTGDGSLRFYNSNGLGPGNLLMTLSPVDGTDSEGNSYVQGFEFQGSNNSYVQIVDFSNNASIILNSGASFQATEYLLQVNSTSDYVYAWNAGPTVTGYSDFAGMEMSSSTTTGSSYASGNLIYETRTGGELIALTWSNGGTTIYGANIYAAQPGVSPFTPENWHYVGSAGNPAFGSGFANVGGGAAELAFRALGDQGMVAINGYVSSTGAQAVVFTLPTAYIPNSDQRIYCSGSSSDATVFSGSGAVEVPATSGDYYINGVYNLII